MLRKNTTAIHRLIKSLFILLLIVGCTHNPPKAKFYIGMTEKDFIEQNKNIKLNKTETDAFDLLLGETESTFFYTSDRDRNLLRFYYDFVDDTLRRVHHGTFNYIFTNKEIDYDKYATPPE